MKLNTEPVKEWFGYTRRERRASFILLIFVIIILFIRITIPERNMVVQDVTSGISDQEKVYSNESRKAENLIPFVEVKRDTIKKSPRSHPGKRKQLIELNSCDTAILATLPGIGPVLSARIVKFRNLLGGFANVEQLKEVYGLKTETYELIKGRVSVDTSAVVRIKINSAGYKELSRLKYFDKYEVSAILKFRQLKGRFNCIDDLINNKLIAPEKGRKVRPYLDFE